MTEQTERTVQVPVSLIERALRILNLMHDIDLADEFQALLSRPTLGPVCKCGHAMNRHTQSSGCTVGWASETYGCRCGAVPAMPALNERGRPAATDRPSAPHLT